jgi:Uracil DNA glycosylase superfamily
MTWADNILEYHFSLETNIALPESVEWLFPYENSETKRCMKDFYRRFYDDKKQRTILLGINPGRFGAGVTGVPFTDPLLLENACHIPNTFHKRRELSSAFVYEFINALGGVERFYRKFYITSICPLGFIKNGKNYNYYDSRALQDAVMPMILENLKTQIDFGAKTNVAYSMGKGKNFKFLNLLNDKYELFDKVLALPHPRWVMQYRLKSKDMFVEEYVDALGEHL